MTVGVAVVALVAAGCSGSDDEGGTEEPGAEVVTTSGPVRGAAADGGVTTFLGIPYAAPPVGDLRWRSPRPPESWTDVREATDPGRPCLQWVDDNSDIQGEPSEDCLYLNVYQPTDTGTGTAAPAPEGGLPVMFWVHGGGFIGGSAVDEPRAALAAGGPVLVVSANYRLGPLGYLAHPAFAAEADGDTGTYAIQDLTAALRWVKDNAATFGGDPDNVTIFGQSAGSMNVCALMSSPPAADLFDRAITQSGPCTWSFPSMDTALTLGQGVGAELGCADGDDAAVAACLRAVDGLDVLDAGGAQANILSSHPWTPAVGNATLPRPVPVAIWEGDVPKVPVMVGTVRDEGRAFTNGWDREGPIDEAKYVEIVRQYFPDRSDAVLATYPVGSAQPRELLARVITDAVFSCAANTTADLFAESGVPVYAYEFDVPDQAPVAEGLAFGATHSSELYFLFPEPGPAGTVEPPADDVGRLSAEMIGYWTRFAATGDPNDPAGDAPEWPRWEKTSERVKLGLVSGDISVTDGGAEYHHCDLWR